MRFVQLAEQSYVIGLWWQVRPGGPAAKKTLMNLARETAKEFIGQENYNCVALRTQQYGLGYSAQTVRQTVSLAAALRPLGGQDSFLGVFHLDNSLWWVCAISKGIIAADGDAYFQSQEEAIKAANSLRQLFAGGEEAFFDTQEDSIRFLLPLLRPEDTLEDLFPSAQAKRRLQIKVGCVALALLSTVGFFWFYIDWQEQKEAIRQQAAFDATARYKKELQEHPERFFSMVWQNAPEPTAAGAQCSQAMLAEPLVLQAWSLDEMTCVPAQSLLVSRLHNRGATFIDLPPKMRLVSAQKASLIIPLKSLQKRSFLAHADLLQKEKAGAIVYQITQSLNAHLEALVWEPPEKIIKDDVTLVAPWLRGKFVLAALPGASVTDLDVFRALEIPGLIIVGIVYQGQAWKIQGVIYARTQ